MGKTHLLHAVGHQIARLYPSLRLLYLSTERFTNELGRDVKNSVPEPGVSSRSAVVRFIRMQNVELPRQARVARPAVVKRLDAGCRHSDGVGVVPMGLERARGEEHL